MKIFLDTANIDEIKKYAHLLDGVTTNPSLLAKEGKDLKEVIKEICSIVDGPISAEVISERADDMIKEAREFSKWHKNVVIKIPMTEEGIKATKILETEGIRCNVTLVFSASQALIAAKAGASFVSPFVGRLDDIGHNGMNVIAEIMEIYQNYDFDTEVIVASIRHPLHVLESARLGAHIATIPPNVMALLFKHQLTDVGIKKFLDDWNKIKK